MQPRREPLLWLQCLALGAIPLELLLIRLVLAGADPGPVPGVERVLIWGVGVLAPAVALWRRPADWGSLLLVRQPLANRSSEQLRISATHGGLSSRVGVAMAAVILLPILWWLDDSAVLASEFSPVSGQSRLVTLLLVSPLSALIVWQLQQLVQAAQVLLGSSPTVGVADGSFRADAVAAQRTSLGLQTLNLPALDWPEPEPEPERSQQGPNQTMGVDDTAPEPDESTENVSTETDQISPDNEEPDDESAAINPATAEPSDDAEETAPTSDQDAGEAMDAMGVNDTAPEPDDSSEEASGDDISSDNEEPDDKSSAINHANAAESDDAEPEAALAPDDPQAQVEEPEDISADDADDSTVAAVAPLPVEPEQPGEEQESTSLDAEVSQIDTVASGSTEGHGEQAESSRRKESEPEQST